MKPIQILFVLFSAFAVIKVLTRQKRGEINGKQTALWIVFWVAAAGVALYPESTGFFARALGIGRGADLVVYVSLALLFYIVFRLLAATKRIERELTEVVRKKALEEDK